MFYDSDYKVEYLKKNYYTLGYENKIEKMGDDGWEVDEKQIDYEPKGGDSEGSRFHGAYITYKRYVRK